MVEIARQALMMLGSGNALSNGLCLLSGSNLAEEDLARVVSFVHACVLNRAKRES